LCDSARSDSIFCCVCFFLLYFYWFYASTGYMCVQAHYSHLLKVCWHVIKLFSEFHQILQLHCSLDKDELIRFGGQKVNGCGHSETKCFFSGEGIAIDGSSLKTILSYLSPECMDCIKETGHIYSLPVPHHHHHHQRTFVVRLLLSKLRT